ncbi:AsmA-like C-terminal region-containing protein [Pleomorphomonas sp. JP5]|uniref:AsmA-like C-terminal region-containing protein n=1 Tax=Pleomorphomonas sp. JP5 TaxID=2942998 RepID=UPI002043A3D2|nr:AsmA-like C-terminal region-containing protein [Pleomorphomonas sp. JP5]MCM5560023.1 AsmA-like C-terminal region-containing protein [Pleomorphomonas sp. JP5]
MAASPDVHVDVGLAGVKLGDDLNPELIVRDIRLERPNDILVSVNEMRVAVRWPRPVANDVPVEGVVLDHVLVSDIGPEMKLPPMDKVVLAVRRAITENGLRFFEIRSFGFGVERPGKARRDVVSDVSVTGTVKDGHLVEAQAIGLGTNGAVSLRLTSDLPPAEDPLIVKVETRGFDLADLAAGTGRNDLNLSGAVSLAGAVTVDADKGFTSATWQVVLGSSLRFGDSELEALAAPIRLDFDWDPEQGLVTLNPSPVVLENGYLLARGQVVPPRGDKPWTFDFRFEGQDVLSGIRTSDGRIAGSYDQAESLLVMDDMHVEGAGISFTAAARASHRDGATFAVLSGVSPRLPAAALKALWPVTVAPDVRSWIGTHIHSGLITNATVDLVMRGDVPLGGGVVAPEASLAFDFSEAVFTPFDDAPMIRDAVGHGRLSGNRFEITVDSGWVDLGQGRRLELGATTFAVPVVDAKVPDGEVTLRLSGPAAAAVSLWNRLPFSEEADFSPDPAKAAGTAKADLSIRLPLAEEIADTDIVYGGRIDLAGFSPGTPINGRAVTRGDLAIELRDGAAHLSGKALIDGAPADVFLTLPLSGEGETKSVVKLDLDAAAAKKYGLDLGEMFKGKVLVEMADNGTSRHVSVNLANAEINLPLVGFRKPVGKPGTLIFDLAASSSGTSITNLALKAGSAQVEGQIALDGDGNFIGANLSKFNFSATDRLTLKASTGENGLKVAVNGSQLDARALVGSILRRTTGTGVPSDMPLVLSAAIANVTGEGGEQLDGLNLTAAIAGGRINELSLTVQTSGGGSASATVRPSADGRDIRVEAGEVGRLLRFLGVYRRVYGGRATLTGSIDDQGVLGARIDGNRWKVVEEPALAQLSTASRDGPTEGLSTTDISRLVFDIRFGNGVLSIGEGFIRTGTAGLTMAGDVDFSKNALRLAGSYLPANQLDSVLASIPLLGQTIFAGGGRSGLLGVSYRLSGPIDAPSLSVNPLSAIAPGIFRRLFELK